MAFCKFLSANDSGETGGHQSGILISISARKMLFTEKELSENHILKKDARVKWQDDFYTDSCFTWYESKKELRITRFGRRFPLLRPEYTGALFVLTKNENEEYEGYILNSEDDILAYLDAFGLTPAETNRLIEINRASLVFNEAQAIQSFIEGLNEDFPSSYEMSKAARDIQLLISGNDRLIRSNPDGILLDWADEEYRLFRAIEDERYGTLVKQGFPSVDQFVILANQVLNEADRLRDQHKYLCTMQQGISSAQMDEMEAEGVILVVPKRFISTYPRDKQSKIWTVNRFISHVRQIENI